MVSWYVREAIAKRIAGDIVWSDDPGMAMKKWREIFNVSQADVSRAMGVSPSVISDYEKGRRVPGSRFVKRFVESLIKIDGERGWQVVRQLAKSMNIVATAILDMREFDMPIGMDSVITAVKGCVLTSTITERSVYGYTVLDSIEAIETLTGHEFYQIMGMTTERVLVFTRVSTGRSPMVAVRVSPLKPAMIVLHGPRKVDPLAIRLADKERIPLVLSLHDSVESLISALRACR